MPECEWSNEDCKSYETPVLMFLKDTLIKSGIVKDPSLGWDAAKLFRSALDKLSV